MDTLSQDACKVTEFFFTKQSLTFLLVSYTTTTMVKYIKDKSAAMPSLQSLPRSSLSIDTKEINEVHVLTREVFLQAINSWY